MSTLTKQGFRLHQAVTPSDSTVVNFESVRAGTAGTLALRTTDGAVVTYTCVAGEVIPVRCERVMVATTSVGVIGWK